MKQPSSLLEPQRHGDHGGSPFLVVDLAKVLVFSLCVFASLRETRGSPDSNPDR